MCFKLNISYTLLSSIFPIFPPIVNLASSKGVNKTYKKTFIFITLFSGLPHVEPNFFFWKKRSFSLAYIYT